MTEVIINQLGNIEILPSSSPVIELSVTPVAIEVNLNPVPINGVNGKSAYEIAVDNGFVGNENEWLLSLKVDSIEWTSTNW